MKIKEFVEEINDIDKDLRAYWYPECILINYKVDAYIKVPLSAKTFFDLKIKDESSLFTEDIKISVSNKIDRFIATPLDERFPEKKYRLRWFDSDDTEDGFDNSETYLGRSRDAFDNMFWSTYSLAGAEVFTESQLEELKKENPHLAPAVDAMKEPVEENE